MLCYVVLLVMPVMGRMSDQNEEVRLMASRCFANLVTLMPLEVSAVCVCMCVCVLCIEGYIQHHLDLTSSSAELPLGWYSESSGDASHTGREERDRPEVPGAAPRH